ncbi:MAG TPA: AraC family transcriptional regulator, partial [bacterium]|nr:AraC family transcriptional regulator [bacterium]
LDVLPAKQTTPKLNASIWSVGDLTIGAFDGSAVKMVRTDALAQDCSDDLIMCIERKAHIRAAWGGTRERELAPGDIHLWRADCSMRVETKGGFSAFLLAVPRVVLSNHGVDIDPFLHEGGLCGNMPETRLLSRYTDTLISEIGALSRQSVERCAVHVRDLVILALGGARDAAHLANGRSVRVARLCAIKSDIEARLTDPGLNVAWITKRHGISERYLRSLFADDHMSFTSFVLERRLMRAHAALSQSGRSVSEIAYSCGFSDLSWFNRAFRQRFGMTPSEVRARLLELSPKQVG